MSTKFCVAGSRRFGQCEEADLTTPDNPGIIQEIPVRVLETSVQKAWLYAELTADFNLIHLDETFAAQTPFAVPIVHGTMGLNLMVDMIDRAIGGLPPGTTIDVRFIKPVPVGAVIQACARRGKDEHTYEISVELADGQKAIDGACITRAD